MNETKAFILHRLQPKITKPKVIITGYCAFTKYFIGEDKRTRQVYKKAFGGWVNKIVMVFGNTSVKQVNL